MKKLLASVALISVLSGCAVVHDPYYTHSYHPVYPVQTRVIVSSPHYHPNATYHPNAYVVTPPVIHQHYYRIR